MMKKDTYIGIYWKNSRLDVFQSQKLILETLQILKKIDKTLETWYKTEQSLKGQKEAPIEITKESISTIVEEGFTYNDDGIFETELGTVIYLKSEKAFDQSNVLSIKCGKKSVDVPNSIVLEINNKNQDRLGFELIFKIFTKLIEIWEPENGIVTKHSHKNYVIDENTELGLISYSKTKFHSLDEEHFYLKQSSLGNFIFDKKLDFVPSGW